MFGYESQKRSKLVLCFLPMCRWCPQFKSTRTVENVSWISPARPKRFIGSPSQLPVQCSTDRNSHKTRNKGVCCLVSTFIVPDLLRSCCSHLQVHFVSMSLSLTHIHGYVLGTGLFRMLCWVVMPFVTPACPLPDFHHLLLSAFDNFLNVDLLPACRCISVSRLAAYFVPYSFLLTAIQCRLSTTPPA